MEGRVLSAHPRPVCIGRKHSVVITGGAGSSSLPCAMVLTAYFALSSVTGLFCHRRSRDSPATLVSASVGAPGPHAFAVRVSATRLASLKRPPHPAPNVRDDHDTPLLWRRDGESCKFDLGRGQSEIFFAEGLDSKIEKLPVGQISFVFRHSFSGSRPASPRADKKTHAFIWQLVRSQGCLSGRLRQPMSAVGLGRVKTASVRGNSGSPACPDDWRVIDASSCQREMANEKAARESGKRTHVGLTFEPAPRA
jgi:hypothetical protein